MRSGGDELQIMHEIEIALFREFKKICEKHNLRYYAIQGTTLGAIFWKGFIPWDDDMDIGMPIPDYERFLSVIKKELPPEYAFLELGWYGGKLHNRNTTFIESSDLSNPKIWHGVFIDIVPLIALPDNENERKCFFDEIRAYHLASLKSIRYPREATNNKKNLKEWRSSLLHRYTYGETQYITDFSFGYYYMFKTDGFRNAVIMDFCSEKIPVSSTYDFDLKSRYGIYEKYPQKKNRVAHNSFSIIDLKSPYQKYEEEMRNIPRWIKDGIEKSRDVEGVYYSSFQWLKKQYEDEKSYNHRVLNTKEYKLGKLLLRYPRKSLAAYRRLIHKISQKVRHGHK